MSFRQDLERGNLAEKILVDKLISSNIAVKIDEEVKEKWDIIGNYLNKKFSIEVKYDEREKKTGNIAIEVFNTRTGKPSGIMNTEATLFAYILKEGEIWLSNTEELKKYINENKPIKKINNAGDGNARIYLYHSLKILPDIFHRIDKENSEKVKKIIEELLQI
jgi:hypothetical protein